MSEWAPLCRVTELPGEGEAKEFTAGGKVLCVARVEGSICAMDNECPHRGGPLGEGMVEEGKVVCPWHGWAFDPKTGAASHNPNAKVQVYEIRIGGGEIKLDGGDVYVKV